MDIFSSTIKVFSSLIIIIGLIALIYYFLQKFGGKKFGLTNEKIIKVVATHYLGPKRSLNLMEIGGEMYLLGITPEDIKLLKHIRDTDVIARIKGK